MNDEKLTIECAVCDETQIAATAHEHEGLDVCADCWPNYAEENGLCESCGTPLEAIYENNGYTEPEGPSHWEVSGYKPCVECNQPDDDQE